MKVMWNILYVGANFARLKRLIGGEESHFQLFSANSQQAAAQLLRENDIHLVFVDLDSWDSGNRMLLDALESRPKEVACMVTGKTWDVPVLMEIVNRIGLERSVPKPWKKVELEEAVNEVLTKFAGDRADAHLVQELKNIIDEMKFLHQISQKISEKKPLPKLLKEIMESSKLLMNAEASSLLLYEPADKKLYFQVATGSKGKSVKKYSVDLGVGISGWVAKHKQPLLVPDCYEDPRFSPDYDKKTKFKTRSMICVPLIRKKQLLGVIQVINKKDGSAFEERDLTLFMTLASQCAIAIENHQLTEKQIETEALERELETAREIQENLLPATLPDFSDIQVAARLIPAKQVGGDFYTVLRVDENKSFFLVADVSGKGIPAALIVSTIDSCLNSYFELMTEKFDLMSLVHALNVVLIESTTTDKFATCWFGLYLHDSRKLISVNAGHNPPFLIRRSRERPEPLQAGGLFLGGFEGPYEMEELQLEPEDVLIVYTDGITEAFNTRGKQYGDERLMDLVLEKRHLSAEDLLKAIEDDVDTHVGEAQQSDDITCTVLKVIS